MKPKHKRLITVLIALACIFTGTFILLNNFKDNLIYFYPPKDIASIQSTDPAKFTGILKKSIRVGGMVKQNSYHKTGELDHQFTITDFTSDLDVNYHGLLPPMFREGQGVIAQGVIIKESQVIQSPIEESPVIIHLIRKDIKYGYYFRAKQLLTKHDEKYMPPEIARSLDKKPTK